MNRRPSELRVRSLPGRLLAGALAIFVLSAAFSGPAEAQSAPPADEEMLRLRAVVDALRREVLALEEIRRERRDPGAKIGVVDLGRAFAGYERARRLESQLNVERVALRDALEKLRAEVKAEEKGRDAEAIRQAAAALEEAKQASEAAMRARWEQLNEVLLADIREEARRYAAAKGFDLVLTAPIAGQPGGVGAGSEALFHAASLDITDALVTALNQAPRAREPAPALPEGEIQERLARTLIVRGPVRGPVTAPPASAATPAPPIPTSASTPRPEDRSLRYAMEVLVPKAIGRPPLTHHKIWSAWYRDNPVELAAATNGIEHRRLVLPIVDGGGAIALARLHAGESSAYEIEVLGVEVAADWPAAALRDIAPFHWVVTGRRFRLLIGGNPVQAAALANFLTSSELAAQDRFAQDSILPAAVYEERSVASLAQDLSGRLVEGGFRVDSAPSPTGFLAHWTGRPVDLRAGDVVRSVGGVAIDGSTSVESLYRRFKHAEGVEVEVTRDGAAVRVPVEVWPPGSADALLRRLDHCLPDGLVGAPLTDQPSPEPRRGRHEYSRDVPSIPLMTPWTDWPHDGRPLERRVFRTPTGAEAGEVTIYATDLRNRAARASAVARLASPAPFQWVFAVDRFVLAIHTDESARKRPEVRQLVDKVRAYVQERGGEEVFGLLDDWR